MKYTNEFFGVSNDDSSFDLAKAVEAYEWVLANPDEAPFVVSKMLFDNTAFYMEANADRIAPVVDGYISKRLGEVRLGLSRRVSKSKSAGEALSIVEEISKAIAGDPYNRDKDGQFSSSERRGSKRSKQITPQQKEPMRLGVDALTAMTGSKGFADYAMNTAREAQGATDSYLATIARDPEKDWGNNEQMWRRMQASSKLAYDMGGKYLPENAQFALKVGEWAGQYAPQAEKVIGPTARRGAYRYRGVEKSPNRVYQNDIDALRHEAGSGREAHEWLIYGKPLPQPRRNGAGVMEDRQPSKTIEALKKTLPDPALYELNRKAGTIPPSQGIIIDRSGKVVTEAVGYGEDWYLPFNLRNLSKLKGGEYIRTRAYGGLTTEDIYAGLVSGARSVTVVSHSGVYTLEFDDDYRGARRYNDKSGRMHARYAQLLDAVKSGDVTLAEPSPARLQEIVSDAADSLGLDPEEDFDDPKLQAEVDRLRKRERRNPVLAEDDKNAAIFEAVDQHISEQGKYAGINDFLNQQVARGIITQDEAYAAVADPASLAVKVGAEGKARAAVQSADMLNRQNLNPLALNGYGYAKALDALKDQFPYYITRAEFQPAGVSTSDKGYVKPKYNRPEGALDGFYDLTINGKGKISADQTNYQNNSLTGSPDWKKRGYTPRDMREQKPEAEEGENEEGAVAAKEPAKITPASAAVQRAKERNSTLDLVKSIQSQERFSDKAALPNFAGTKITDDIRSEDAVSILYRDIDDLRSALMADPGGTVAQDLNRAIKFVRDNKLFDVNWAGFDSPASANSVVDLPGNSIDLLEGIVAGKTFNLPDVRAGRTEAQYDAVINDILAKRTEFKAIGSKDGVNPLVTADASADEVVPALSSYAASLVDQAIQWEEFRSSGGPKPAGSLNDSQINAQAKDLAKIIQAYKNREAVRTPKEPDPKAEASDKEAVRAMGTNLRQKAKPFQEDIASMIGMDDVSDQVDALVNQAVVSKQREAAGLAVGNRPMHLIFEGNPGTGKTTIAQKIAPLYKELGLVSKGEVVELKKGDITGQYENNIEEHTYNTLMKHKGKVIFIDEAYQFASDDFGRKSIDAMVPILSDPKFTKDTVVILAGYPDRMQEFLEVNPGLADRFSDRINFRDYTAPELHKIANKMIADQEYVTNPTVNREIGKAVAAIAAKPDHANGRTVARLIDRVKRAHEARLGEDPTTDELRNFTVEDVRSAMKWQGLDSAA